MKINEKGALNRFKLGVRVTEKGKVGTYQKMGHFLHLKRPQKQACSTEMEKGTCENGNGESVEGKGRLSDFNRGIHQLKKRGIWKRGRGSFKLLLQKKNGSY